MSVRPVVLEGFLRILVFVLISGVGVQRRDAFIYIDDARFPPLSSPFPPFSPDETLVKV